MAVGAHEISTLTSCRTRPNRKACICAVCCWVGARAGKHRPRHIAPVAACARRALRVYRCRPTGDNQNEWQREAEVCILLCQRHQRCPILTQAVYIGTSYGALANHTRLVSPICPELADTVAKVENRT